MNEENGQKPPCQYGQQMNNVVTLEGPITIASPEMRGNLVLFDAIQIGPEGKITKLKNFTTEDEMSIRFWDMIDEAFPKWLKKQQNNIGKENYR